MAKVDISGFTMMLSGKEVRVLLNALDMALSDSSCLDETRILEDIRIAIIDALNA